MVVRAICVKRVAIIRRDLDSLTPRQISWLVFLATLCVYFSLTPYVLRHWWLTGDEPHYLLATHSIVADGDLRLANNYEEKDFLGFYVGDDLGPILHVAKGKDGDLYPIRGPGFSLLLVPAYLLGGRAGVAFFLDLVGALLAMNFYLLGYEVTRSRLATLVAWVFVFFTPLLLLYTFLLYPEVVGALILIWALRRIMGTSEKKKKADRGKARDWILIGFLIALLPWLSNRFIPFAGILFISALVYEWRDHDKVSRQRAIIYLLAPCIASALLYFAYNYSLFGKLSPFAAYDIAGHNVSGRLLQARFTDMGTAMLGWLLDPRRGLFIYAPVYILSIPGILLLLREKRIEAFLLLPYPIIVYLYMAWAGLYWTGWEISPRYMVSVMPILGIFIAYAFTVIKRLSFQTIALALFIIGLLSARYIFVDPLVPYASTIVEKYNRWNRFDINPYLPHFLLDYFLPGHLGFAGVGTLIKEDKMQGSLPLPRFRDRILSVVHTTASPGDEGYAFIADLGKDPFELPRGAYEAHWFLKIGDNTSQETVAIIDVLDPRGEVISKKEITASDFQESGTYQKFVLRFDYPLEAADRGEPILRFFSTATADLWIAALEIDAVTAIPSWMLATLWLTIMGIFSVYYCLRPGREPPLLSRPQSKAGPPGAKERSVVFPAMTAGLVLLIIASLGNYLVPTAYPRVFEAESLRRLTGEIVADEDASAGKAAYASVGDPEQMLIYGPYEFFPPGRYVAKFRMKVGATPEAAIPVVSIDVYGAGSGVITVRPLQSSEFKEVGRYRTFHLRFRNPVQQALQFRVYFPGVTDLWVDEITVERFEVVGRQRNFVPPSPDHPLEATLGEMVRLLGYDLGGERVRPGEEIGLTLYWQALAPADRPYKVFTHLIDEENAIWGQHDSQPVGGTYPPNLWVAGEVVADSHRLLVAAEAPAGIYRLEVGMYYEPTGERLPVYIDGERVEEGRVLLGEIEVGK